MLGLVSTVACTFALLPLLIGPPPLLLAEPPASDEPAATAEPSSETPEPQPTPTSAQKREWMLVIAPGFDYIAGSRQAFRALGGGFRFGGHAIKWAGGKGRFLVGGGPILHYAYLRDPDYDDTIHLVTVNGDLLLGGGNQRWGIYWHLTFGVGYFTWEAYSLIEYPHIVVGMIVIGVLGLVCSGGIRLLAKVAMPWQRVGGRENAL